MSWSVKFFVEMSQLDKGLYDSSRVRFCNCVFLRVYLLHLVPKSAFLLMLVDCEMVVSSFILAVNILCLIFSFLVCAYVCEPSAHAHGSHSSMISCLSQLVSTIFFFV